MKKLIFSFIMIITYSMFSSYDLETSSYYLSGQLPILASTHQEPQGPLPRLPTSDRFASRDRFLMFLRPMIYSIVQNVYEVELQVVSSRLEGETLNFRNLQLFELNLLGQARNHKKLKLYFESNPSINIQDLKQLLLFAEGKKSYSQFKKFDQDQKYDQDEESSRMIIDLLRKKELNR